MVKRYRTEGHAAWQACCIVVMMEVGFPRARIVPKRQCSHRITMKTKSITTLLTAALYALGTAVGLYGQQPGPSENAARFIQYQQSAVNEVGMHVQMVAAINTHKSRTIEFTLRCNPQSSATKTFTVPAGATLPNVCVAGGISASQPQTMGARFTN